VNSQAGARAALRSWILERNPALTTEDLSDQTALIEMRYLTSLQIAELLLMIEEWTAQPIKVEALRPGVFATVDAISEAFFAAKDDG